MQLLAYLFSLKIPLNCSTVVVFTTIALYLFFINSKITLVAIRKSVALKLISFKAPKVHSSNTKLINILFQYTK